MPPASPHQGSPDISDILEAPDTWCSVLIPTIIDACHTFPGPVAEVAGRLLVLAARDVRIRNSYRFVLAYPEENPRFRKLTDIAFYACTNTDQALDFLADIVQADRAMPGNPPSTTPAASEQPESPPPVDPMGPQAGQHAAPPGPSTSISHADIASLVSSVVQTSISSFLQSMPQASTIHAASPANESMLAVARQLVPIVASHGEDCCPFLMATGACDRLANSNAPRYKWAKDAKNAVEIRACLSSMAHFLSFENPNGAVFDYLRTEKIRLAPTEFNLVNWGPAWVAAELGGCIRAKERSTYATLVVARMTDVDPGRLDDYASGKLLSSAPAFGGRAKESKN